MKMVVWLEPLVNWFWDNRDRILKDVNDNVLLVGDHYGFQVYYPEFGGMPDEISQHLTDYHLTIINANAVFMLGDYPEQEKFKAKFVAVLTNSTVTLS
jgi:hypothetical protein